MDTRILLLGLAVGGTWVGREMRRGIFISDTPVLASYSMGGGRVCNDHGGWVERQALPVDKFSLH